MRPYVRSLAVAGFKSIADAHIALGGTNILIGANGVGKSNFIGVFRLLRAHAQGRLDAFVRALGGPENLFFDTGPGGAVEVTLVCGDHDAEPPPACDAPDGDDAPPAPAEPCDPPPAYPYRLRLAPDGARGARAEVEGHDGALAAFFARVGVYQFHDTTADAPIRRPGRIDPGESLRRDGGNLAAFVRRMAADHPDAYAEMTAAIRLAFPHFDDFVFPPPGPASGEAALAWREYGGDRVFEARQLSDGLLRFIALSALLLQPEDDLPPLLIVDEPELGLHPYAVHLLAAMLQKAALRSQVIAATQSVTLVDQFQPEDIVVVDRLDGRTTLRRLDLGKLGSWLDEYSLGELWEKNVLGGRPAR